MKTWFWTLLAVAGGYAAYRHWFAGGGETPDAAEPPMQLQAAAEPGPVAEESPPSRPPLALDIAPEKPAPAEDPLGAEWRAALSRGDTEGARGIADRILVEAPESDAARWVHYDRGREALRRYAEIGKNPDGLRHARTAWLELTPVLFARDLALSEREELRDRLRQLAQDLIFTRHVEGMDRPYVPKRGDSLSVLCSKVFPQWGAKASPGFLVEVNQLGSAKNLRAGTAIRVPLGEPKIVIVKSEFRLYFLLGGGYVRDFPVGLGREGTTPEGTFAIDEMIRNPDWHPRAGVIVPYGDPRNILGTRWLAFRDTPDFQGFGIHGTTEPSSIGKEASSGCVRMLREDVERVFEWTSRGTEVVILR